MAENASKLPIKTEEKTPAGSASAWRPFENFRNEMNRLFDDFDRGFWRSPFRSSVFDVVPFAKSQLAWPAAPAVDVVEKTIPTKLPPSVPALTRRTWR